MRAISETLEEEFRKTMTNGGETLGISYSDFSLISLRDRKVMNDLLSVIQYQNTDDVVQKELIFNPRQGRTRQESSLRFLRAPKCRAKSHCIVNYNC